MSSVASWSQPQQNPQVLDFDELFASPGFNASKLLSISNIIDECRKQNDKITELLISNSSILQDLMNICIRPFEFKNQTLGPLTREHAFRAIQILNNLNCQQFSDYMLGTTKAKPNVDDDQVVTQQNIGPKQSSAYEIPLVRVLYSILRQKEPLEQTPLWYMYKIGTLTCYQRPKKLLVLLRDNKDISQLLFHHFYSNSILQWVVKILELEDSNSFFQNQKIIVFQYFVDQLGKQVQSTAETTSMQQQLMRMRLENYVIIMKTLLEKMEDRFDKSKYLSLVKLIFNKKQPIEPFVNCLTSMAKSNLQQNQQKVITLMAVVQNYEHFSSNYKPNVINKINNSMNRSRSLSKSNHNIDKDSGINAMGGTLDKSTMNDIVLNSETAVSIRQVVTLIADQIINDQAKLKLSFILEYSRLLFAVLLVYDQSEQPFVEQIVSLKLSNCLFGFMRKYPTCTALHNLIKDIFIECMFKQYDHAIKVLFGFNDCKFLDILAEIKGKGNSFLEYENQIYHIFLVAARKSDESLSNSRSFQQAKKMVQNYQQILCKIKQKQRIYTALIGGNPRKQSSCWGDSSQDEKLLPFNFNQPINNDKKIANQQNIQNSTNANDIIEGNIEHWFDCGGLPLDSDESKDDLQVSLKQESIETEKREQQGHSFENQLVKRFKNFGVVECEEQQIRIPKRKDKTLNDVQKNTKEKSEAKQDQKNEMNKQIRDQGELELQRQIEILKNHRMHLDTKNNDESPQIIDRVIKKVDSLNEEDMEPININVLQVQKYVKKPIQSNELLTKIENKIPKTEEQIMISNQQINQKQVTILGSSQDVKIPDTSSQKYVNRNDIQNRLMTYLHFQIEHIISELD